MHSDIANRPVIKPTNTAPLGTFILDREAFRETLVEALLDPRVLEAVAAARAARGLAADGTPPRFMSTKEYAQHTRISTRTLQYVRSNMIEGTHYSRTGTRIRFHVKEADEFVATRSMPSATAPAGVDLKELTRIEAARRNVKPRPARKQ